VAKRHTTAAAAAIVALAAAGCGGAAGSTPAATAGRAQTATTATAPAASAPRPLPRPSRVWSRLRAAGVPLALADIPVVEAGAAPRLPRFDPLLPLPATSGTYPSDRWEIFVPTDPTQPWIEGGAYASIVRRPAALDRDVTLGTLVFRPRRTGLPRFVVLLYRDRRLLGGEERLVAAAATFTPGATAHEYRARKRPVCAIRYFPAAGAALMTCSDVPTTAARDPLLRRAARVLTAVAAAAA
jgi:hypothetical protein